jgi:hypothetical protein
MLLSTTIVRVYLYYAAHSVISVLVRDIDRILQLFSLLLTLTYIVVAP